MTEASAMPFEVFRASAIERGYTRFYQEQKNCVVYTFNGIKSEIKKKHYTFGWLRSPEDLELIKEAFLTKGYKLSEKHKSENCVNILFTDMDPLEQFWLLVETIEEIEGIVAKERGQARKVFAKEVDEENKFVKIVKRYQNAIENKDQELLDIARNLLSSDSIDRMIVRGQSVDFVPEKAYREHAVPCILIHNEIIRMVLEDRPVTEITQMIISNLAIVMINDDQAYKLDVELGLRSSMPDGWKFGDSIYARFDAAKIILK